MIKQKRDYQTKAIEKVIDGFKNVDRGQLIMPCGTGKTLTSLWIHEAMNPNYTLVLFPSLALLRQTKNEWSLHREVEIPYICVCSEKDIDKNDSVISNLDDFNDNVSTDPATIKEFLENNSKAILFSTYQSLNIICNAMKDSTLEIDLALCDEAHKTAGYKKSAFGLIHHNTNIRVKKRLYMTATPKIFGSKTNNMEEEYICAMDNSDIFGTEFYSMSFKEAIRRKILVDYEIVALGVNDDNLHTLLSNNKNISNDQNEINTALNHALGYFMKKYEAKKIITFHSSVRRAVAFQHTHHKIYKNIKTFHANGKLSSLKRNNILNSFSTAEKSVITNARCLTEGVDVPSVDAIYFCDPRNSKIDIVQATGRALRYKKEKKIAYIVIPFFHKDDKTLKDNLTNGSFKNLVSTIRALKSIDENVCDKIKVILNKEFVNQEKKSDQYKAQNYVEIEKVNQIENYIFDQIITQLKKGEFLSFEEARDYVRSLKLKTFKEWRNYAKSDKKPQNIPFAPECLYKEKGWIAYSDWLGNGKKRMNKGEFLSFEQARDYARSLKLKTYKEWLNYAKSDKRPENIPFSPHNIYKEKGWISYSDWLGNGKKRIYREFLSFEEARDYVRSLKLKTCEEWRNYAKSDKKPVNIPSRPDVLYKEKGWISFNDWFGNGK